MLSKNRKKIVENIDFNKVYEANEAIKIIKEKSFTKFKESLDVAINLNIDSSKPEIIGMPPALKNLNIFFLLIFTILDWE